MPTPSPVEPGFPREAPANPIGAALAPWVVLALGLGATAFGSRATAGAHAEAVRAELVDRAHVRIQAVSETLAGTAAEVVALQALYRASEVVEREEFETFSATLLAAGHAEAFEWAPRVSDAERTAWEQGQIPPAAITELQGEVLRPADHRPEYFPVDFLAPATGSEEAHGFDLASAPARARALERARRTGGVVTSEAVELVLEGRGFLLVAPVFRGETRAVGGAPGELAGFVVSVSRVRDLLAAALERLPDDGLVVRLYGEGEGDAALLGTYPKGATVEADADGVSELLGLPSGQFRVEVSPTPAFAAARGSALPPVVAAAGLAISLLVAGYVRQLGLRTAAARSHAARLTREMEERQRAELEASELEARFRALAEEAPVGIYLLQDGLFRYVNRPLAALFGREVAEIVDRLGPGDLRPEDPDAALAWNPGGGGHESRAGDRRLEIHAATTRIGGREAVIGTVVDVTELRAAAAEHARAERLESLGLLAGGIAHDFNNLLAVILGNISMAQLEGAESPLLAEAERAVLRAQGLTAQLSTFSRGGEPVTAPTDLGPVLREAVAFAVRGSLTGVEVSIPEGLWSAQADSSQMSRVFHNLVLNAVQAMEGAGRVVVSASNEVRGTPGRRYVAVRVHDEGKGMDPEVLEHIFDAYFTTKSAGRGLGLASAHSIVRRHHGVMEVASTPGQGATFSVFVPACDTPAPARADEPGVSVGGAGRRVLVMDDDPFVRSAAVRLVESHGYTVVAVDDGAQAVAAWRGAMTEGRPFAAALLDLTVPEGLGGREAMAEIRTFDPGALGIASSGYADDPILAGYREHGFAAVLPKPYRREEIGAVLRRVLAGR